MRVFGSTMNGLLVFLLLLTSVPFALGREGRVAAAGPAYTLTLAGEGGVEVAASPTLDAYAPGAVVAIRAAVPAGVVLVRWSVDGQPRGWANPLVLTMDGNHTVVATGAARPNFSDVSTGSAAYEAIGQLAARGVARGYPDGRYGPDDTVLRAQATAFISRALGWDAESHENTFTDRDGLVADLWQSIATLAYYGVARGYDDGKFHPNDPVLRAQTISFIARAMVARGYWQMQPDDPALYPAVPASSGHRGDIATYVHYAGALPDTQLGAAGEGWAQPASRAWFARAIWQALDSALGGTTAPPSTPAPTPTATLPPTATATRTPTPAPTATATRPPAADITVTIDRSRPTGTSQLWGGVTHTKEGLGTIGDPAAIARAKNLLGAATRYQNRQIYGWGARNPNPAPGVYDWTDLDAYVASMRSMGAIPVITLALAPDWMTAAPQPNRTGEPPLDPYYPPTPEHYGDFAELARQVALRYPDVKHFQVWNEMKGFAFPYTEYTTFYNRVYDALKGVDPSIQVGGFYLTFVGNSGDPNAPLGQWELDLVKYWLQNKHGADFICLDGAISHFLTPFDGPAPDQAQMIALTYRYEAMTRQVRALTSLPIWWSEDYLDPNEARLAQYASDAYQAAGLASILYHELVGGAAVSLRWGPIGNPYYPTRGGNANIESLLSPVDTPNGGQPYPSYNVYLAFHQYFGPGTQLYATTSSSPDLEVLARDNAALLINKRPTAVTVSVNGALVTLAAYEVRVLR